MSRLQQHLPFTVLKPTSDYGNSDHPFHLQLQQHLPFTVLKPHIFQDTVVIMF